MQRNSRLPMLILGLLTVLAVGAAVLGLSEAPPTADLTVHNGAGETLAAPSLTARYTDKSTSEVVRVQFRAPDQATETLVQGGPREAAKATGARALALLQPFSQLLKITGFSPRGSAYVATQPASALVAANEASEVSGLIHYTATVSNGYLVDLVERYHVRTPGGTESGTYHYRVTRIGGQKAPAA